MKKILVIFICILLCPSVYAREKNLYPMIEGKVLKVYLGDFKSSSEKVSAESFRAIFKDALLARKTDKFSVVNNKEESEITISADILAYKYLEKDPVDNVVGGTTALIVDAMVTQNYAQVQAEFSVYSTKTGRKLWQDKFPVSVTRSNMPEPDSIPAVLNECSRRFIALCFGRPKK